MFPLFVGNSWLVGWGNKLNPIQAGLYWCYSDWGRRFKEPPQVTFLQLKLFIRLAFDTIFKRKTNAGSLTFRRHPDISFKRFCLYSLYVSLEINLLKMMTRCRQNVELPKLVFLLNIKIIEENIRLYTVYHMLV